jgi:glycosyltransferase involved in cell wall biosynthesis
MEHVDVSPGHAWLADFERSAGRPLRVLHIGNIANNAYNNALIQRQRGIDAYVLSFDYYHIMATPEWEDADFSGDIGDDFFPDWWAVDLKGFERPRWFIAAPLDISIRYLLAEITGTPIRHWLWRWATFERWLISRKSPGQRLVSLVMTAMLRRRIVHLSCTAEAPAAKLTSRILVGIARRLASPRVSLPLRRAAGRLRRMARMATGAADTFNSCLNRRYGSRARADVDAQLSALGRSDRLANLDFFYGWWCHPYMSLLLGKFDVVQAYATYTAIPFLVGRRDDVAYEHGTIRHIPFQDTAEGRMCAVTYRSAAAVCITNTDNLSAAGRLGIEPARVVRLPHAFDSEKLLRFARENLDARPRANAPPIFLTPTRQHWRDADLSLAKGNDRVFHALRLIKDQGHRCTLRAVAWGKDLEDSKALTRDLGIEEMIDWLPTMKKRDLWRAYLEANAVIDQFLTPAMGGITFEALILGRRVISHLDFGQNDDFFGRRPPILQCSSIEEIREAVRVVIDDPHDKAGIGQAGRDWMLTFHSADRIVELQLEAYARLVLSRPARNSR